MATRYPGWGTEQKGIQLQYAIGQAKNEVDELAERLESLRSLGKFTDKEYKAIEKALASIKDALEKLSRKKA
jgi:NADPH-dependent 7-cyano-7-deazaguanine reductase QueF